MKIASRKNEKNSTEKTSTKTLPNVEVKFGQSRPISKLRIVPVITPTANSAAMIRVQRRASVRYRRSPVRRWSHSANSTIAGNAIPKQTSGMCTENDSACICRAWSRYAWWAVLIAPFCIPRSPVARRRGDGMPSSWRCSALGDSFEQHERVGEQPLLLGREVLGDRLCDPAVAVAAIGFEPLPALRRQLDGRATAIGRVGAARDQPVGLHVGDRLRHRLRAHALCASERADRAGAFAVEAPEHGALRERKAVLRAQPADEMPEHEPQPAGQQCRVDLRCHITTISK